MFGEIEPARLLGARWIVSGRRKRRTLRMLGIATFLPRACYRTIAEYGGE